MKMSLRCVSYPNGEHAPLCNLGTRASGASQ